MLVIIASSAMNILKFYGCTLALHRNNALTRLVSGNGVIHEEMLVCLSRRGFSATHRLGAF